MEGLTATCAAELPVQLRAHVSAPLPGRSRVRERMCGTRQGTALLPLPVAVTSAELPAGFGPVSEGGPRPDPASHVSQLCSAV